VFFSIIGSGTHFDFDAGRIQITVCVGHHISDVKRALAMTMQEDSSASLQET